MPVAAIAFYLGRLVLDGSVRDSADEHAPLDVPATSPVSGQAGEDRAYDRRRRVLPTLGLLILGLASAVLATAHYVEPFRGVGGQQLLALLALYAASLIALGWSVRAQGRGVNAAVPR
jgi:hypothetical protein